MVGDSNWCLADTATQDDVDALSAELARGPLAPRISLLQDPRWLSALVDDSTKSVRAYVWRCGDAIVGYAGFLVHPSALRVAFGELTLLSIPVRHLRSFAAPVVATGSDADDERHALDALFRQMRQDLAADEVIFVESALADSTIMKLPQGVGSRSGTSSTSCRTATCTNIATRCSGTTSKPT